MAETRVTTMKVKVDLTCEKCKKKIKKVLCQIPEIQNQVYDEKNNAVTITVVCCSPEKIKKKILCKGGDIIEGIEILPPKTEKEPKPPKKPESPPRCVCCRHALSVGNMLSGPRLAVATSYCSCHGCYGRPVCECWGSGCGRCYVICEENPPVCAIM